MVYERRRYWRVALVCGLLLPIGMAQAHKLTAGAGESPLASAAQVQTLEGMQQFFLNALARELKRSGVDVALMERERNDIVQLYEKDPGLALAQANAFRKKYRPQFAQAMTNLGVGREGIDAALGPESIASEDVSQVTQLVTLGGASPDPGIGKNIINAAAACNGWLTQWICHYAPPVHGLPACELLHLRHDLGNLRLSGNGLDWIRSTSQFARLPASPEWDGSVIMRMQGEPAVGLQVNQPVGGLHSVLRHTQVLQPDALDGVGLICVQTRARLGLAVSNSVGVFGSSAATATTRMVAKAGEIGLDAAYGNSVSAASACGGSQYYAQRAAGFDTTVVPVTLHPFPHIRPNAQVNLSWQPSALHSVMDDSCWLEGVSNLVRNELGQINVDVGFATVFQHDAWNGTPASVMGLNVSDVALLLVRMNGE